LQSLFEYQTDFARQLLQADSEELLDDIRTHRNNIFQTLTSVLKRTFCTVERLIGASAFDALAAAYIRECPPTSAIPADYGHGLPQFLTRAVPQHPCLPDLARFDALIEQTGREFSTELSNRIAIGPSTTLRLPRSLRCARFEFAVDSIRDAIAAGVLEGALALPASRNLAIWRTTVGVSVRNFSGPAFQFLQELQLGRSAEMVVESIKREVIDSPLCHTPSLHWNHTHAEPRAL
jgi:hypothetical protein